MANYRRGFQRSYAARSGAVWLVLLAMPATGAVVSNNVWALAGAAPSHSLTSLSFQVPSVPAPGLVWTKIAAACLIVLSFLAVFLYLFGRLRKLHRGKAFRWIGSSTDMTYLRQIEAAKRELDRTARLVGVGGWEVDLASSAVFWSPETCRLIGVEPGYQPSLQEALSLYPAESRMVITTALEKAVADRTGFELDLPFVRKGGAQTWVRVTAAIECENDRPTKIYGAFQDVAGRIAEQAALQRANVRATLAAESGGIGIWDWDLHENSIACDAQMYRLCNLEPDDEQHDFPFWSRFVHHEDIDRVEQALRNGIDGIAPYETEYRIIWDDGSLHHVKASGRVSHDSGGKPLRMVGTNVDVTPRVSERLALEEAKERIAMATSSGSIGIWEWDIAKDRMILDECMLRFYDLEAEADQPITYESWALHLHPDDRAAAEHAAHDSLDNFRPYDTEFRVVWNDGSVHFMKATGKVTRDSSGKPIRMVGTTREITAQKEAEHALRNQADLLDLAHDSIIVRGLDGSIRFWNHGAEEMYGYSKQEAAGMVSHELLRTLFPEPLATIDAQCLANERWEGELQHTARNGTKVIVASRWVLQKDKVGQPSGVMEINSDVTDQRGVEESLRESHEKEQLLFHGLKDYAILMLNPDGTVATWNEGAERIKGFTPGDIIGCHFSRFYTPEAVATGSPARDLETAREQGRFEETGWRMRKDGSRFWANVVITALFDTHGTLRGFGKITRDITEQKRAEEATEIARIEAEASNRAKSDFLANMSHEVRTPVNAIMGMAHLALRANPSPRQRGYLTKIDSAAKRLLGVMNDILDFSKIEAGKLNLEQIAFSLEEVLKSARDIVEEKARQKHIPLVFSVGPDVAMSLVGDPLRLGQVLINLVNNAIKFTERGKITVRVESSGTMPDGDDRTESDRAVLRFMVTDTGIGMTPPQISNLFQSFQQADTSFTRQYGGTGLGLAISKQLVELMSGTIGVESEFGSGSRFTFTAAFGIATEEVARPPATPRRARGKLLIVDDSESTRDWLLQLLLSEGYVVSRVSSGEEALGAVATGSQNGEPFDLVLMDWRLPGINGIETARRIQGDRQLSRWPAVVVISAFERAEVLTGAADVILDGFLVKPIREATLLETVASVLGGEHYEVPALPPGRSTDPKSLAGAQVLLVEDNDLNRELATELLRDLNIVVTIAIHGREAVEAVNAHKFDLVLMDIQMPEMDGLQATRLIRTQSQFDSLPIVAMTAHAMAGDRERSLAVGMNDHLTKPIDPAALTEMLLRWMPTGAERQPTAGPAETQQIPFPDQLLPFDIPAALARTNFKPKLLRKMMLGFVEQYGTAASELREQIAQGRLEEAHRLAHSLKGVAATLEAKELAAAVAAVEHTLRDKQGASVDALIDAMEQLLDPAIAAAAMLARSTIP